MGAKKYGLPDDLLIKAQKAQQQWWELSYISDLSK